MALVRCHRCRGTKRYQGIGWVEQDCDLCSGTGRIEAPKSSFIDPVANMTDSVACNAKADDTSHILESKSVESCAVPYNKLSKAQKAARRMKEARA